MVCVDIGAIEGIIFDMDGTLLDSMEVWIYAGEWYLETKGKKAEKNLYQVLFSMSMKEGAVYLQQKYRLEDTAEEIVDGINQIIWDFYETKVVLKPGIAERLQQLKEQGVKLTIATATDYPIVEMVLKRLRIFTYFEKIFTCSQIGAGKSQPDIFLAALAYMGTSLSKTWIAEDALYALKTAKAAGFPTIGVYDKFSESEQDEIRQVADFYVESWKEVCKSFGN